MIGADPEYYLLEKLRRWSAPGAKFHPEAVKEYVRCFSDPLSIHASCEDYRAAASIDIVHDEEDMDAKITCPLLALWGKKGSFTEPTMCLRYGEKKHGAFLENRLTAAIFSRKKNPGRPPRNCCRFSDNGISRDRLNRVFFAR